MTTLTMFIGCMFSGKSTALVHCVKRQRAIGKSVIVVNHKSDTRCAEKVKTHDGNNMDAQKVSLLKEIDASPLMVDLIAIDEAQFFEDLVACVLTWLQHGISVVVAGLSGDFRGIPFHNMTQLIPHADEIVHKKALCMHDNGGFEGNLCGEPAIYSKRIVDSKDIILAGGKEQYRAVCRKHFHVDDE